LPSPPQKQRQISWADLLNSTTHLEKGADYDPLNSWLGEGLLLSKGTKWHQRRKALTPAFHFSILDQFMRVFNEQANILVDKLRKTEGARIDIFPLVTRATLDIICEAVMGVQINSQNEGESFYLQAVDKMNKLAMVRFIKPWLRIDSVYRWSSYYAEEVEALRQLHGFTDSVIRSRKAQLQEQGLTDAVAAAAQKGHRLAFLDLLLLSSVDGRPLSPADVREEVDTFMFEGHDTTSSGVVWALYNLGRHPEIQQRAYEEVAEVLGEEDRPVTRDDLAQLKYLQMVIKESLRLMPPVPMIQRKLAESVVIDGHLIPSSFQVTIYIHAIHLDPRHWPDPERFDPDRFLPEAIQGRHPYSYVPFSAGPRNCIGQRFAQMEEQVVVATVLKHFKITAYDKYEDLRLTSNVILRLEGPLWLSFTPRQ